MIIQPRTQFGRIRWQPFLNDSGEAIPPWSLLEPTDFNGIYHTVQKPTVDDSAWVFLNGSREIPIGGYGSGTWDLPNLAKYEEGDGTPAWGESWGSRAGFWGLSRGYEGFLMMGPGADGRVMVERDTNCVSGAAGNPYYGYFYWPYPPFNRSSCPCCFQTAYQWDIIIDSVASGGMCGGFPPTIAQCNRLVGSHRVTHVDNLIGCRWGSTTPITICPGTPLGSGGYWWLLSLDCIAPGYLCVGANGLAGLEMQSFAWTARFIDQGGSMITWSSGELAPACGADLCLAGANLSRIANPGGWPESVCQFNDPIRIAPV